MAEQHNTLTDPELHEPKGVSTASADTVYVAGGSGTGTWKKLPFSAINAGSSTAGTVMTADGSGGSSFQPVPASNSTIVYNEEFASNNFRYIKMPYSCKIKKIFLTVISNSTDTAKLEFYNVANSSALAGSTINIPVSQNFAEFTAIPTSDNTFNEGDLLRIKPTKTNASPFNAMVTLQLENL